MHAFEFKVHLGCYSVGVVKISIEDATADLVIATPTATELFPRMEGNTKKTLDF